jgi:PST family polysaccharide transporter
MIATSDWLVFFLLGPQWSGTSRIFMLLGIAAIIQPVTKTAWWLFSTQGRTSELFRWGLISGVVAILSIIVGLPWGATGVAAAYAVSDLCLTTPFLFWYVGRKGPIRAGDFYLTIAPAVCAAVSSLIVLVICRPWLGVFEHLITRLTIAGLITFTVSFLTLSMLPTGRRAMQNLKEMLRLLLKGKREFTV